MTNKQKKNIQKQLIRVIALILAFLLVGGAVISGIIVAFAETETPAVRCNAHITQLDSATYQIHCEINYTNSTGNALTGVLFSVYANQLRRESALSAEPDLLEDMFPAGYAPGGIEFSSVTVNGEAAEWGMQDENEEFLRVACDLPDGESAVFGFDYALLLIESRGYLGYSENDVRLTGFLPAVCLWDDEKGWIRNAPSSVDRYALEGFADYEIDMNLPDWCAPAAAGTVTRGKTSDGWRAWHISAKNVREFALSISGKYRTTEFQTAQGADVRVMTSDRTGARSIERAAKEALDVLEGWFGALPTGGVTIVETDMVTQPRGFGGVIWLPSASVGDRQTLTHTVRRLLAQQYIGIGAGCDPAEDPWLSAAVPEFLAYRIAEETQGRNAMLKQLNADCLADLLVTLPARYSVDYPLLAFNGRADFTAVIRHRGAAAFYQVCEAMGAEAFTAGISEFYRANAGKIAALPEFAAAFQAATGRDYTDLIVNWMQTISDYQGAMIDWFE